MFSLLRLLYINTYNFKSHEIAIIGKNTNPCLQLAEKKIL